MWKQGHDGVGISWFQEKHNVGLQMVFSSRNVQGPEYGAGLLDLSKAVGKYPSSLVGFTTNYPRLDPLLEHKTCLCKVKPILERTKHVHF